MGVPDMMVFVVTAYIVTLTICGELRDAHLCSLRVARGQSTVSRSWQLALKLVLSLRRYTFAPGLVSVIGMLVAYEGGDAMSLCKLVPAVRSPLDVLSAEHTAHEHRVDVRLLS